MTAMLAGTRNVSHSRIIKRIDIIYVWYILLVMLETRLLRALVALDDARSVTLAAERLNVTQPALSTTLRRLRELFDDALFVRSSKGLIPTETADRILVRARQIIDLTRELEQNAISFDATSDSLDLQVAASDFVQSAFLPNVMQNLPSTAPNVTLTMRPLVLTSLDLNLERGDLDFAIVPDQLAPTNLQMRKLFNVDFLFLMRRCHPISRGPVTIKALSDCEHLRILPSSTHRSNRVGKIFRDAGYHRNVRLTVSSYASAVEVISKSDLVALVPRIVAPLLDKRFMVCEPPFTLEPITMSLIWHARMQNSMPHIWARQFFTMSSKNYIQDACSV